MILEIRTRFGASHTHESVKRINELMCDLDDGIKMPVLYTRDNGDLQDKDIPIDRVIGCFVSGSSRLYFSPEDSCTNILYQIKLFDDMPFSGEAEKLLVCDKEIAFAVTIIGDVEEPRFTVNPDSISLHAIHMYRDSGGSNIVRRVD